MSNRLGEIVKAARGEVSLRDYAKQIGISHSYLSSIESGVNPSNGKPISIGLETIEKLSRVTGYSVSYLTGEKEKPTEPQDGIGELTEEEKDYIKWFREEASEKEKALVRIIVKGGK